VYTLVVKLFLSFLFFLAGSYVFIVFVSYKFLEKIIYPIPKIGYQSDEKIIFFDTENGNTLAAEYRKNPESEFVVLYSHGNGEDIGKARPLVDEIFKNGFSTFSYDYSGYGLSEGNPSEFQTYQDIDAAYVYLREQLGYAPEKIVVYGRSIGGGPSLYLASRVPIAALVLESTFASIYQAQLPFVLLPFDKYSNVVRIADVHVPTLILHGSKDWTVRPWNAKRLFAKSGAVEKRLVWIDGAGHDTILRTNSELYRQALRDLQERL